MHYGARQISIGSGEVECGGRELGLLGQALLLGRRLRAPFRYLAGIDRDPGARHPHRFRSEGAGYLTISVPLAIAFRRAVAPIVAHATKKAGELFLENRFDGCADVGPRPLVDRVEPGLPGQWRKAIIFGNLVYGVVSLAVADAGWVVGC